VWIKKLVTLPARLDKNKVALVASSLIDNILLFIEKFDIIKAKYELN
jgi:hypothetical protein